MALPGVRDELPGGVIRGEEGTRGSDGGHSEWSQAVIVQDPFMSMLY